MNKTFNFKDMLHLINEQLEAGGSAVFTIHGTSMNPMMKDRIDSVRIVRPIDDLKKYDIIFYKRDDGSFVLHRIIGIKDGNYVCRGDNQVIDEFPVLRDSVIGVVSDYTKNGKWKEFKCLSQRVYSRFWINTVFFRKIKRKLFVFGHNIKKKLRRK